MGIWFMLELEPLSDKFPGVCGASWGPVEKRNEKICRENIVKLCQRIANLIACKIEMRKASAYLMHSVRVT